MSEQQYAVIPPKMVNDGSNFALSPGHIANGFLFISGQLGLNDLGQLPTDPIEQADWALKNLQLVLDEANCDFSNLVELTTYHVGKCSDAVKWFIPTKHAYFSEPFPAWTAISVASLALDDAIIEISAIAKLPT